MKFFNRYDNFFCLQRYITDVLFRVDEQSEVFSLSKRLLLAIADSNPTNVGALLDRIFLSLSTSTNKASSLCLIGKDRLPTSYY